MRRCGMMQITFGTSSGGSDSPPNRPFFDVTPIALFAASTTIVVLAGFLLCVLMRPNTVGEVVVGTGALSVVVIEADSLVVGGLLESYRPVPLLLGAIGLLLVTASPLLSQWGRQAGVKSVRLLRAGLSDSIRRAPRHPVVLILVVAVAAAYAVRAYLSVRLPNVDWDGLMYHLVGIDEWITTNRISHNTLNMWADAYPQSVELFVGWTCVHLHHTIYAGISQWPLFLIGAASTAGLARRIGARRSHAVLAGLIFLATPAVLVQFGTNYVDAAAASLGLATLYLVTGLRRAVDLNHGTRAIWMARLTTTGLVAGLAVGAKSNNLLLVPFLVVYLVAVQLKRTGDAPEATDDPRPWLRRGWAGPPGILAYGVVALAIGGYWYLRTLVKFGNPLYPFTIAGLPGLASLESLITTNTPDRLADRNIVAQVAVSWASDFHPFHTVVYDQRLGGLGMQWGLILVPLAILATFVWWHGGRRGPIGFLMLILVCVVVASPAAWWARYVLLSAGLAAALSAFGLTWLAERLKGSGIRRPGIVRIVGSVAATGIVVASMWTATRSVPYQVEGDAEYLSLGGALDLAARSDRMDLLNPWFLFRPLKQVPDGVPVAVLRYATRDFTHPLFGNRYEHDVIAVGAPKTLGQLSTALTRSNIDYVVLDDANAPLLRAAAADRTRFRLLSSGVGGQMGRAHLFEHGDFSRTCREPGGALALDSVSGSPGKVTISGRLTDGCEAGVPDTQLQVWGFPRGGKRADATLVDDVVTDSEGRYRGQVDNPDQLAHWFTTFVGTPMITADRAEVRTVVQGDSSAGSS